ncbi:GntR family transcriptional regulator [Streptomyces albus]|uniref:GntR family transcriptional regulator n=1 Tax=Streptomyces albus TaxID=1888 RepID=A0A8H1L573_9ACTN|nr:MULTISPECIES: GntR family transcriptional regulator [Streptomyces]TGG77869.1 GntR family transcriptional regulator [Streptomyces albus]TXJ73556.1 GntR family transcriptional regulator [Streptomyces lavendulae]
MAGTVAGMAAYIRARIERGTLAPGDRLPPTKNLMQQFNLSDNAVYRAVGLLKAEGLVVSQQGKGVFVADRRALISGERRIKGIVQPGEVINHKSSTRVEPPVWVQEQLGEGEAVRRVRTITRGDVVLQASQSWVHTDVAAVVPEIDQPQACDPTWQAVYAERAGKKVTAASKTVDARISTDEDKAALGLDEDAPLIVMRSIYVSEDRVIGVGEGVYAPGQQVALA